MPTGANRVRERREACGLAQKALASGSGLSRQGLGAIEAGRASPAVDVALRIAAALGCRVEDLFGPAGQPEAILAEPGAAPDGSRVAVAHIAGRWVSHALDRGAMRHAADGLTARRRGARVEVELTRPSADVREPVLVMGCAAGLALLADRLNCRPAAGRYVWLSRSSTDALQALATQRAHVAGVHLVDSRTGESNVADVRRVVGGRAVTLITLARWEIGLVVGRGNPKGIKSASDLGRRDVRLVSREPGSGARRLLERQLRAAGVPLSVCRSAVEVAGHLDVAHAVVVGAGDVGIASRDAAIELGTGFVPLTEERYDLVVPSEALAEPRLQRLFDTMSSAGFRRELSSLGYDLRSCGDRVATLDAA